MVKQPLETELPVQLLSVLYLLNLLPNLLRHLI
jgi:hypothetical protein